MKLIVIGAGAAGMTAAIFAARNGNSVVLLEKNEKLGKKIYITGKGRCNVTNDCTDDNFFKAVKRNPRFLYSSYSCFNAYDAQEFFRSLGLEIKVERGNRVFPASDKSSDVIRVLGDELKRLKVEIKLNTMVSDILTEDGHFSAVKLSNGQTVKGDACVIATGGLSYPTTGSTGDGYRFAEKLGHTVKPCSPSLIKINLKEDVSSLQGLSLKNVTLTVTSPVEKKGKTVEKQIYSELGEMLFTDAGISGPIALTASTELATGIAPGTKCFIDLKPALNEEQLDARVLKDFSENINKQLRNSLGALLPSTMADYLIERSGISPYLPVHQISAEQRMTLVRLLKAMPFNVKSLGGFNEAIITCGGVNVKEIDPSTMGSKIIPGVYFAGEVLDLDAVTGGYNLQIAWTTGVCAGRNAE